MIKHSESFPSLQSINADYKLIKQFGRYDQLQKIQAPRNLVELGNLLNNKISKMQSKSTLAAGREWLSKKGLDIQPLLDKIATAKLQLALKKPQKQQQQDCYFYLCEITPQTLPTYLQKAKQYAYFNLIQHTMSSSPQAQTFLRKMMIRLHQNQTGTVHKQYISKLRILHTNQRSIINKNNYIQIIKKHASNPATMLQQFQQTTANKIWQVLAGQLLGIDLLTVLDPIKIRTLMLLNSLTLIQQEFNAVLPQSKQLLTYYLNTNYLVKLKEANSYIKDIQHGSFWGYCFLLYRAGRKNELFDLLSTQDELTMLNIIFQTQQSISCKSPIKAKYQPTNHIHIQHDVFYQQLVYSVNGQFKYSSQTIAKIQGFDVVWILVRNLGVFYYEDYKQFQDIRAHLVAKYKNSQFASQFVLNRQYLLDYNGLVNVGQNQLLDRDDYIHLLLLLRHYPFLQTPNLSTKLTQHLTSYILQLLSQSRQEYIYYMLLLPLQTMAVKISWIVNNHHIIQSFHWHVVKERVSQQVYVGLVDATLRKHVEDYGDYLLAARKSLELLGNKTIAIDYLVQMMIQHYKGRQYAQNEIKAAQKLALHWCAQDQPLNKQYGKLYKLFISHRQLATMIVERNDETLMKFISGCQMIVVDGRLDSGMRRMFEKLVLGEGFYIYLQFLANILKGADICMLKTNRYNELLQFKQIILKTSQMLVAKYGNYEQGVGEFVQDLQESLWEMKNQ